MGNEIKFRAEITSDGLYLEAEFYSQPVDTEDSASSQSNKDGGSESNGSSSSGSGDSSKVKFEAVFQSVVSYVESNGTPGYQNGEEVTVTDLASVNWDAFACNTTQDASNATVISCTLQTSDLNFEVVVHIVDQSTTVSGVAVNPTGVKIDVNFAKSSSNYLAVIVGFQSQSSDSSQDGEMSVDGGNDKRTSTQGSVNFANFGFFSWVTTATINGQTINVINSNLTSNSNTGLQEMVFSFETAEIGELYWDPVLAVQGTSKLSNGAVSVWPSLFLLAALAVLAL